MPAKYISSPTNDIFRSLRELLTAKGIKKQGRALISGAKIVPEMLTDHAEVVEEIIYNDQDAKDLKGANKLKRLDLAKGLFAELDVAGTGTPLLVVKAPKLPTWDPQAKLPKGCTLIVPFQNPENVGGVIRTAAAMGVAQVVLLSEAAHPLLPKSVRAAGTSLYKVPLLSGPKMRDLEIIKAKVCALDMGGKDIAAYKFADSFVMLAGIEGQGIDGYEGQYDALSIPMHKNVESLNAATAVAIALYVWQQNS